MNFYSGCGERLVAIVHSSSLLRAGLTGLLSHIEGITVIAVPSLEDLEQAVNENRSLSTVLFNIDDFSQQIEHLSAFKVNHPSIHLLTLAHEYSADELFGLFSAGVSGALLDDVSQNAIELAVALVSEGAKIYPASLTNIIMDRFRFMSGNDTAPILSHDDIDLSEREIEILKCLTNGASNKKIALSLDISEATVKVHVKSILRKIKVDNRTQAAIWALRTRSETPSATRRAS